MSDIIKSFAQIGAHYLENEKRVKNKAYEYEEFGNCELLRTSLPIFLKLR